MARPLADALEKMQDDVDLSSLVSFGSTAAIFSQTVKEQLQRAAARLPRDDRRDRLDRDGHERHPLRAEGRRAEGGHHDRAGVGRHGRARRRPRTRSSPAPAWSAGSRAAATSRSATTTIPRRPRRRSSPTRRAGAGRSPATTRLLEADGRITLLGRGSVSINSGGEKIYPEEVEGALKSHPDVFDVLVVGVPDERWGERVAALLQPRAGQDADARGAAGALPRPHRRLQGAARAAARRRGAAPRRTASPTTGAPRSRRRRSPRQTDPAISAGRRLQDRGRVGRGRAA